MLTRAEKLFNIRAQVQKAVSEIEHGAVFTSTLALADALEAVLRFLEEEMPEKPPIVSPVPPPDPDAVDEMLQRERRIHPMGEKVKEAEPAKIKRR
jgi:hypothetical protein